MPCMFLSTMSLMSAAVSGHCGMGDEVRGLRLQI